MGLKVLFRETVMELRREECVLNALNKNLEAPTM
jgi:hypothetical protein